MRTLTLSFLYTINGGETKEHVAEVDTQTAEDIKQEIADKEQEQAEEQRGEDEEGATYTPEMVELESVECDESTEIGLQNCFEVAEAYSECDQDIDVVLAAIACGVQGSDIDEAYAGSFKDDEDFAQDMHEQTRSHEAKELENVWPFNCIDWEYAAKELMYDYSEDNGHYFRNF